MKKQIQKCRIGSPGLMPITSEQTKRFAEWLLKGIGKVAEVVNDAAASALSTPTGTATTAATTPVTSSGSNAKVAKEAKKQTKEFIEQNGVVLSPSSWVVGKGNPWQGAQTIATWDPRWQLGALAVDALTLSKGKPALKATGNAAVDVAARAGNKTAKAKAVSRRLGENVKKVSSNDPNITEYSSRNQYERETTFMAPWRSKGKGDTVGDFIDYNYGFYGGKDRLISDLTQKQRDALLRSVIMTDERPGALTDRGHYLIHMDDTGPQPVNRVGLVPKDASNSNSPWISGGTPEIWWNRNTPYYNHRQYRTVQDIPTTYIARQGVLEDLGVKFDGTQGPHVSNVVYNPGVVPFEGIDFALRPNPFGGFDRIKLQGSKSIIGEPLGFGQSTPTIQNRPAPAASPLVTRLMRLQNKKDAGIIPKTDQALIIRDGQSDALIEDQIVKAYKRLGIDENTARSAARTTVMSNGKGVHTPVIGDDGNLIGGISYIDRQQALKALRESGITNPTESDLQTIMGHEWGHQVEVPGMDKEVYTQLGQVLDNEGVIAANPNWTVWDWINKIEKYLSEGRLDNGISAILERLYNMDYKTAQKFVANVNRFSAGTGAAYLLNNQVNKE